MKVIIAGHRDCEDYELLKQVIHASGFDVTSVLSGGCRGVDKMAERWSREFKVNCTVYPARWDVYRRHAGPMRNAEMVANAEALIALLASGSKGTADVIKQATAKGLHVYVYRL